MREIIAELPKAEKNVMNIVKCPTWSSVPEYSIFSKTVEDVLVEKIKNLQKMEIVPYQLPVYMTIGNRLEQSVISENVTITLKNTIPNFLPTLCVALSLSLSLRIIELGEDIQSKVMDKAILEDIEMIFENPTDYIPMDVLIASDVNPHIANIQKEITYQDEFGIIMAKKLSTETKINEILHSNITDYTNIFSYIMGLENLSLDDRVNFILNSGITNYQNIFTFLLWDAGLTQFDSIEYIVHATIASYEEKFQFIIDQEKFTLEQKVWYALMLPDVSFETIFKDLISLDANTEEIISIIIETDTIPFKTLFSTILKNHVLSQEQFVMLLVSYNSNYNAVTTEEKINYLMQIPTFSDSFKADAFLAILSTDYSLDESVYFILDYYNISYLEYLNYYFVDEKDLTQEQRIILSLFAKINEQKEKYILEHYDFETKEQLDKVIGGVAAEGSYNYYDLYWVSNVFFNRITDCNYAKKGTNPYLQFIEPHQFSVYSSGAYKLYLNPSKKYVGKYQIAKQAFYDMFYAGYDGICHDYLEFRSSDSTLYNHYIDKRGNRYGCVMNISKRIIYENLIQEDLTEEEYKEFVLRLTREKE